MGMGKESIIQQIEDMDFSEMKKNIIAVLRSDQVDDISALALGMGISELNKLKPKEEGEK